MNRLIAIFFLICSVAEAKPPVKVTRGHGARGRVPAYFATDSMLCDAFLPADRVGNWWCLKGDTGTMATGSTRTLAPVGSPTQVARPVCPNGTNCDSETMTLLNVAAANTQYFATAADVAAPTGSFTTCAVGQVEDPNHGDPFWPTPWVFFTDLAGATTWSTSSVLAPTTDGMQVSCIGTASASCSGGGLLNSMGTSYGRTQMLVCGVFQAGVKTLSCLYAQGDAAPTCATANHAIGALLGTAHKWAVGFDTSYWHGFMRGAFFTEKAYTATEIGTLGAAVLVGSPAGQTFTRASVANCCRGNFCTALPPNVPCIVNGVSRVEAASTNYSGMSEGASMGTVSNSFGVSGLDPAVTVKVANSPWGLKTMTRVVYDTTLAAELSGTYFTTRQIPAPPATGAMTATIGIMGNGQSGSLDIAFYEPNSGLYNCATCPYTDGVLSWCSVTGTLLGPATNPLVYFGNLSFDCGGTPSGPDDVFVATTQIEPGSTATSFISTQYVVTSMSRAAETCTGVGCP